MSGSAIAIRQMIVHRLDHRSNTTPEFSDLPAPNDPKAAQFVVRHINGSRTHRRARQATFLDPTANTVMRVADALFAQPSNCTSFVTQSQEIANLLFAVMRKNQRISPGDLVVCLYEETASRAEPALALLKLDPQSGFRGVTRRVGSQTQVVLQEVTDVLTAGELQKCAFIVPPPQRGVLGHDLVVLDQQTGRFNNIRQVASFFLTSFLQCKVGLNRADLTYRFVQGSIAWVDTQMSWDGAAKLRFKERIYQVVANEKVDVVAVANEIIAADDQREAYIQCLRDQELQELTFQPDPEMRERLMEFVTFEGDDSLRLRVRQSTLEQGDIVRQESNPDGSWTITIRTNTWRNLQPQTR